MHWRYEWVRELDQDVYRVLIEMLNAEATAAPSIDDDD
jgi:hypothetical protein